MCYLCAVSKVKISLLRNLEWSNGALFKLFENRIE